MTYHCLSANTASSFRYFRDDKLLATSAIIHIFSNVLQSSSDKRFLYSSTNNFLSTVIFSSEITSKNVVRFSWLKM